MNRLFVFANLVLWLLPVAASAAEYSAEPALYLGGQYNDNVRLAPVNQEDSSGYTVEPHLRLKAEEQIWNVNLDSRYRLVRYSAVDRADSDNAFVNLGSQYKTELQTFNLSGKYERNTTVDTVFDTQLPESGLTTDNVERKTKSVSPSWSWLFAEGWYLNVNLNKTRIQYDKTNISGLNDYETQSGGVGINWQLSETNLLGMYISKLNYDSKLSNFKFEQPSLQFSYINQLSESTKLTFSAGRWKMASTVTNYLIDCNAFIFRNGNLECVSPVYGDKDYNDRGNLMSLKYESKTETGTWNVDLKRTINPSGYGTAQQEDRLTYQLHHRFLERHSLNLILDDRKTVTVQGANNSQDRRLYRIQPSWGYKLTKNWNLIVRYTYLKQHMLERNADSESNAIYVTLSMNWPRLVSSY